LTSYEKPVLPVAAAGTKRRRHVKSGADEELEEEQGSTEDDEEDIPVSSLCRICCLGLGKFNLFRSEAGRRRREAIMVITIREPSRHCALIQVPQESSVFSPLRIPFVPPQ